MSTPRDAASNATPGTQSRWPNRPRATVWAKIGMVLFAIGVLAIAADMVLFLTGERNLPLWLNLMCLLSPIGLGVGFVGTFADGKRFSRGERP